MSYISQKTSVFQPYATFHLQLLFSGLLEGFISGPVFKNLGERSTAKNYCPVSLLSVVSKVFEKNLNNRIVDHLEKFGLFSDSCF